MAYETGFDWLRALVNNNNNNPWDYCVIWKLGDDPSRFIEWGSCFCSGAEIKVKDENCLEEKQFFIGECRDELIKHPIRTHSCSNLAKLPSVIPLYSGVHGDVVISKKPRWTFHSSNPSSSDDQQNGTQVLIPVVCGLVELFSTKHVAKDQKMIDYICGGFEPCYKQPNMSEKVQTGNVINHLGEQLCHPDYLQKFHFLNLLPQQNNNYSTFEGSSTCSSLSNEHQLMPKLDSDNATLSILPQIPSSSNLRSKRKKCADSALARVSEKNGVKNVQKSEKGVYKSKNLVTERNRRKRIKAGMFTLRSLVPKITKMDRAATLGDAADYIEELLETIENYKDELRVMEEEDRDKVNFEINTAKLIGESAEKNDGSSDRVTPVKVQVEVSQLGTKDFLLQIVSKQKRGGFSRLMEAMDSLGFQVSNVNVTTFNGSVSTVLKVEAKTTEVEPNGLKHLLMQLIN